MNTTFMDLLSIRRLIANDKINQALEALEPVLLANPLSPYLYILKSRLIQLEEGEENFKYTLENAEECLRRAIEINSEDMEAMEELAHLYDVVIPNPKMAKKFATMLLERIDKLRADMMEIIVGDGEVTNQSTDL